MDTNANNGGTSTSAGGTGSSSTSAFLKKLHKDAINAAVTELYTHQRDSSTGRLPQGSMKKVLSDLGKVGVVTDRNHLNYLLKKRARGVMHDGNERPPVQHILILSEDTESTSTLTAPPLTDVPVCTTNDDPNAGRKKGGRPSGTSIVAMTERCKLEVNALTI
jgi:hypothetical protein